MQGFVYIVIASANGRDVDVENEKDIFTQIKENLI